MAGTDSTQALSLKPGPAIILCEPQMGENIGATARAMANFGLWDLRLVNPRDGWPNEKAIANASKANHVIERVQVFATVEEAIAELSLVYATTARRRDMFKPVFGPDEASANLARSVAAGQAVGLLFGRERWGLNNEEVALCEAIVTLPVEPAFASLNIAQAVLVLAYEWRRASGADQLPFEGNEEPAAPRQELVGLFEHLERELDQAGFFSAPEKRASVVNNIRSMLARGAFNSQEVRTLRGVIASLTRRHERINPSRKQPNEGKRD